MTIPEGSLFCFLDERASFNSMIVGGYYVPKKCLAEIDEHMIKVKKKFGFAESDPIKWNLKDKSCQNAERLIRENKVNEFWLKFFLS